MKGDFSRIRFERSKHYTSVLMQQGRVQLDADANEQRFIDERMRVSETADVVGPDGAPIHAAGFGIGLRGDGASLTIGQGRFYIDGLLCENEAPLDFTGQDYLIDPNTQIGAMLDNLRRGGLQSMQVWLEAWQRFVIPLDDPAIKEVALGEADTTARIQTVWRVVVQGIPAFFRLPILTQSVDTLNQALGNLRLTATANQAATVAPVQTNLAATLSALQLQPAATATISPALADNLRLVHADVASQLSTVNLQSSQGVQVVQAATALGNLIRFLPSVDCCESMRSRLPTLSLPGKLSAQVQSTSDQGPCLPAPNAAYRGLENQLYRVEIHQGGDASTATFKWSRDNGFVVTGVRGTSGSTLTVDSLGLDANFGFAAGQWVEISDDSDEFGPTPNRPGTLVQIQGTDPTRMQVTLPGTAPNVDTAGGHAKMRRWDQTTGTSQGIALSPGNWIELENGVQVMFSADGLYQSGDHWLIPARTATGDIEWPPAGSDGQPAQPPAGIVVHRAPLACLHLDQGQLVVEDCRRIFRPLVEIVPPAVPAALHVEKISWTNDDFQSWDQLASTGLTIGFDQAPGLPLNGANFIVTLELPVWNTFGFVFRPLTAGILQTATAAQAPAAAAPTVASPNLTAHVVSEVTQPAVPFSAATTAASAAPVVTPAGAAAPAASTVSPTLMRAAVLQTGAATITAPATPAAPAPAAPLVTTAAPILKTPINVSAAPAVAAAGAQISTPVQPAAPAAAPLTINPAAVSAETVAPLTLNPAATTAATTVQPTVGAAGVASKTVASTVDLSTLNLGTASQTADPGTPIKNIASTVDLSTLNLTPITATDTGPHFVITDPQFTLPQRVGYARQPYVIDGSFSADGAGNVTWKVRPEVNLYITPLLNTAQRMLDLGVYPRLRIALKGRMIGAAGAAGNMLYLDGQSFAKAGTRADGSQRLDLTLPSGNGEKASDFESWIYVVPQPTISLTLDPTTVNVFLGAAAGISTGTVTLSYSALSDMQVAFSVADNLTAMVRFDPVSVTIAKGTTTQTTQITVVAQPNIAMPSQISITATLAGGNSASAVLNVTTNVP
jgi:hypothetical protein